MLKNLVKPYYSDIGKKISNLRNQLKLTQKQLAIKVEISRATLANIEAGKQSVYIHILHRIANELGVEIIELIPKQLHLKNSKIIGLEQNQINTLEQGTRTILKNLLKKINTKDENKK